MKKLIFALLFATLAARADRPDLERQAEAEENWKRITLLQPDGNLLAAGYLTEQLGFRLESIGNQLSVSSDVTGPYLKSSGLPAFKRLCEKLHYGFVALRQQQNAYKIELTLPRWTTESVRNADARNEQGEAVTLNELEQSVATGDVQLKIGFDSAANAIVYGQIQPLQINQMLNRQIQAQLKEIQSTGRVTLDLTSYDDIICDWLTQKAQITLQTQWGYPSAKLGRETVLSPEDVAGLRADVEAKRASTHILTDDLVLSGAQLALSLNDQFRRTPQELGVSRYLKLNRGLIDTSSGGLRSLSTPELTKLSRSLDRRFEKKEAVIVPVGVQFSGVVK